MSQFMNQLLASATTHGRERGIVTGEPNQSTRCSWSEVHERARRIAGALINLGLARGASVGILVAAPSQIGPVVQAVWLCGGSATMLHQPNPRTDLQEWVDATLVLLRNIGADMVLLGEPFEMLAQILSGRGIRYRIISDLDDAPISAPVPTAESDLALVQLTSGTTGAPKAVMITYENLISDLTAIAERSKLNWRNDVMVSWLPTFHDMGLVGFLILPMSLGVELVKINPLEFLATPLIWPETLTKYRGTITSAPSFAYSMLARRLATVPDDCAFDLSSVRIAMTGAEPVDPAAVEAFTNAAKRFGLDPHSIVAANGMAEATVAASFEVDRGLETDVVEARALEACGRAIPAHTNDAGAESHQVRVLARLGRPLPGLEVRVVGQGGAEQAERMVGEIHLRGNAISPGYLGVDRPTRSEDSNGWFATGDLGYLVDGQIVICGRRDDVLAVSGRTIFPTDVERVVAGVEGVRAGNAAAVLVGADRECFAVVLESRLFGDAAAERTLALEVAARVTIAFEVPPVAVVVAPPGSLPKTTSGKLRRSAVANRFSDHINRLVTV
jgi:fatty-acyl-CoA synthase